MSEDITLEEYRRFHKLCITEFDGKGNRDDGRFVKYFLEKYDLKCSMGDSKIINRLYEKILEMDPNEKEITQ